MVKKEAPTGAYFLKNPPQQKLVCDLFMEDMIFSFVWDEKPNYFLQKNYIKKEITIPITIKDIK